MGIKSTRKLIPTITMILLMNILGPMAASSLTKTTTMKSKRKSPAPVLAATHVTSAASVVCEDSNVCSQYRQFSWAIAKAEGFFIKGSIPNRNHNPGDIKSLHNYAFPGQIGTDKHGHVIFRNDNKGWAALQNQVKLMCGENSRYSPQMTIQQIGKLYAKNWRQWSANVARNMNCDPHMTLAELFSIPPVRVQ